MRAGFLRYAGRRKPGAGGFLGTADYRYESGGGVLGKLPRLLFFPGLCPSCARADPRLPSACRRVYSSPSRRTPKCGRANPENRILRKTQEVRQTI